MSNSLATIRREIGHRAEQPFFRLLGGNSETASASGTTTTLIDTGFLLQADDFWNGQYIYFPGTQEVRRISDFDQGTSTITWLEPIASATTGSTVYEIWADYSPIAVHYAINQALREAWPFFFDTGNGYIVIRDDYGTEYDLSSEITDTIRILNRVIMVIRDSVSGQVSSDQVNQDYLADTDQTFTSADVGKTLCIYSGDSSGDRRTVSALIDANTLQVSSNFTAVLSEDDSYRLLDVTQQDPEYTYLTDWSVFPYQNPTKLWLGGHPFGYEGYELWLHYEYEYTDLSAEADTTTCPLGYLIPAAIASLYTSKMISAPAVEITTWQAAAQAMQQQAKGFAIQNKFQHLPVTWRVHKPHLGLPPEYPFRVE